MIGIGDAEEDLGATGGMKVVERTVGQKEGRVESRGRRDKKSSSSWMIESSPSRD